MSSVTEPAAGGGSTGAAGGGWGPGADVAESELSTDRGRTRIEPAVVEKIAAEAVREVDDATGSARTLLGMSLSATDESTDAQVSAHVDGDTATVEVTMTVIYPASVREVTRRTRSHITDRVRALAGVQVREVDITVAGMTVVTAAPARVR